jgi:hypothetical protein
MTAPRYSADAPKRRSTADVVATVVILVLAAVTASLSLVFSLFFGMATDACGDNCDTAPLDWVYPVTWGGIAIGAIVAIAGVVIAAARGRIMWVWPTIALVLIVVTFVIGAALANSVNPHH